MSDQEIMIQKSEKTIEWLYRWIRLRQENVTIEQLILNRGYKNIAFYGFNDVARCLIYELENSSVEAKYIFDRNAKVIDTAFRVISLDDELVRDSIDAIVICVKNDFDGIREELSEILKCEVITFEDLLYEV